MRLCILSLAAAAFLAAATPALAQRQPGNLSIHANTTLVRYGGFVELSGKLTGRNNSGRSVTVEGDPSPFDTFATLGTANTDAQGDWTFVAKPTENTRYRARMGGEESRIETVNVRPAISLRVSDRTPRKGARVRFFGRFCPEHDNATIALQRRTRRGFRTVKTTTLADAGVNVCSTFSTRLRVRRDSVYRAYFGGDADHAAGPSRRRRVDVH